MAKGGMGAAFLARKMTSMEGFADETAAARPATTPADAPAPIFRSYASNFIGKGAVGVSGRVTLPDGG